MFCRHIWSMQQRGRGGNVRFEYRRKESSSCSAEDLGRSLLYHKQVEAPKKSVYNVSRSCAVGVKMKSDTRPPHWLTDYAAITLVWPLFGLILELEVIFAKQLLVSDNNVLFLYQESVSFWPETFQDSTPHSFCSLPTSSPLCDWDKVLEMYCFSYYAEV